MERRAFLKKIAGYSVAITAGSLVLPRRAKCEIVKPFAEIICNNYLDEIIRKKIIEIKRQNPDFVLGEMHCHSYFSDGTYSVKDLMFRAASLEMDFLVITEHLTPKEYKLEWCLESISEVQNVYYKWDDKTLKPPVPYPAIEIATKEGHLIALFPKEYFKPKLLQEIKRYFKRFYYYEASVEEVAALIREMNGISIIPHPNITRSYPFGISTDFARKNLVGLVDAIEDISTAHGYQENYSKEIGTASIGSSDDHFNILIGTTLTSFDQSKQKDLLQAIRNRATRAVQTTNFLNPLLTPTRLFFGI